MSRVSEIAQELYGATFAQLGTNEEMVNQRNQEIFNEGLLPEVEVALKDLLVKNGHQRFEQASTYTKDSGEEPSLENSLLLQICHEEMNWVPTQYQRAESYLVTGEESTELNRLGHLWEGGLEFFDWSENWVLMLGLTFGLGAVMSLLPKKVQPFVVGAMGATLGALGIFQTGSSAINIMSSDDAQKNNRDYKGLGEGVFLLASSALLVRHAVLARRVLAEKVGAGVRAASVSSAGESGSGEAVAARVGSTASKAAGEAPVASEGGGSSARSAKAAGEPAKLPPAPKYNFGQRAGNLSEEEIASAMHPVAAGRGAPATDTSGFMFRLRGVDGSYLGPKEAWQHIVRLANNDAKILETLGLVTHPEDDTLLVLVDKAGTAHADLLRIFDGRILITEHGHLGRLLQNASIESPAGGVGQFLKLPVTKGEGMFFEMICGYRIEGDVVKSTTLHDMPVVRFNWKQGFAYFEKMFPEYFNQP